MSKRTFELQKVMDGTKKKQIRIVVETTRLTTLSMKTALMPLGTITHISKVAPYITMKVDVDKVAEIEKLRWVKKVWHVPKVEPLQGAHIPLSESAEFLNIDAIKAAGFRGENVKVAVIDTGIDKTHPMFQGTEIIAEKTFLESGGIEDEGAFGGHGTWTASCIAGQHWIDSFLKEHEGMAPRCSLIVAKIFGSGGGSGEIDTVMAALEWACEVGAQVSSNSWGGFDSYGPLLILIRNLIAAYGTIFVFAAGNSGPSAYSIMYPAGWEEVVAVGSVGSKEPYPNAVANYSSRGPAANLIKPDIMAPGGTKLGGGAQTGEEDVCAAGLNQAVKCNGGTSMACPHISGGIALLIQAGIADPVARLYETATDICDFGKDNDSGFGTANFARALGIPPLNSHLLTVETNLPDCLLFINNGIFTLPFSEQLREAAYTLEVKRNVFRGENVFQFTSWSDGEQSVSRTINLLSDLTITAFYVKLSAFAILVVECRSVDAAYPDWNPGASFPSTVLIRAGTTSEGITLPKRTYLKIDLSNIPDALLITKATLLLRCSSFDRVCEIQVFSVENDDWDEETITWNSMPPFGSLLSVVPVNKIDTIYEWSITDFVKAQYAGNKKVSLCVKDAQEETALNYWFVTRFDGVELSPKFPAVLILEYATVKGTLEVHAYTEYTETELSKKEGN